MAIDKTLDKEFKKNLVDRFNQNPNDVPTINRLAEVVFMENKITDAIKLCSHSIKLDGGRNEAWILLSRIFMQEKDYSRSFTIANEAIQHFPANKFLLKTIIEAAYKEGLYNESIKAIQRLKRKTKTLDSYFSNILASCYANSGKLQEAKKQVLHAISLDPKNSMLYNSLATYYSFGGEKSLALKYYAKCVELNPESTDAIYNFTMKKSFTENDRELIQNLIARFENEKNIDGQIALGQSLAKISDDLGDYESATKFWISSGTLVQKQKKYKIEDTNLQFKKLYKVLPSSPLELSFSDTAENRNVPIFIVGLPRSGTSVLEQMISSHSSVTGLGEKHWMPAAINKILSLKDTNVEDFCRLARARYYSAAKLMQIPTYYFTDKLPANSMFLGLIANAIPEAKIIHIKRNAYATCFSCFKHFFPADGLAWTFDQYSVANYYRLHSEHIQHIQDNFCDRIYTVEYEKLMENPVDQMKNILEYCQLPFETNVLSPEKNNRAVMTASHAQVTRKLYKGSSESWKKYKDFLPILFSEIAKIQSQKSM